MSVITQIINGVPVTIRVVSTSGTFSNSVIVASCDDIVIGGDNNIIFVNNSRISSKSSIVIGNSNKLLRIASYCVVIGKNNDISQATGIETCTDINDASFHRLLATIAEGKNKTNLQMVQQISEYIQRMNMKSSAPVQPIASPQPQKQIAKTKMDEISEQLFASLFEESADVLQFLNSRPGYDMQHFIPVWRKDFEKKIFEPLKESMKAEEQLISGMLKKLKSDYEELEKKAAEIKENERRAEEEKKEALVREQMNNLVNAMRLDEERKKAEQAAEEEKKKKARVAELLELLK